MDEIKAPVIKYEVKNGYLYVDDSRHKIDTIGNVSISKRYYFGLDDEPGAYECSLVINRSKYYLEFSILDEDSEQVKAEKRKMLDNLVADIKKLINF